MGVIKRNNDGENVMIERLRRHIGILDRRLSEARIAERQMRDLGAENRRLKRRVAELESMPGPRGGL